MNKRTTFFLLCTLCVGIVCGLFTRTAQASDFSSGPYGVKPLSLVPPFEFPAFTGTYDFRANWTGEEYHVFFIFPKTDSLASTSYIKQLYQSSRYQLLTLGIQEAKYFFIPNSEDSVIAASIGKALQDSLTAAVAKLPASIRSYWSQRVFASPISAHKQPGWIGEVVRTRLANTSTNYVGFIIDRTQKMREVGFLRDITKSGSTAELSRVRYDIQQLEAETFRDAAVKSNPLLSVPIMRNARTVGGWNDGTTTASVTLPPSYILNQYNKLWIEFSETCPDSVEAKCPDWDRIARLYVCDVNGTTATCDLEIGRWITTYKRMGRWITDASSMLALIQSGGTKTFKLFDIDSWITNITFHFEKDASNPYFPIGYQKIFTGGQFNEKYNKLHTPIEFTPPSGTKRVQLAAIISGHGSATTLENCAEFCNSTHHFKLNSSATEYTKTHVNAGTISGCLGQIDGGVVANQYGTWPYGRAGWCPGLDVGIFTADVTKDIQPGKNTISYRALYNNADYVPTPSGQGDYWPEIIMTSYVVFWGDQLSTSVKSDDHSFPDAGNTPLVLGETALGTISPNPLSTGVLTIPFSLAHTSFVSIEILDMAGRVQRVLAQGSLSFGIHSPQFDIADFAHGMYVVRLRIDAQNFFQKIIIAQ